MKTALIIHGTPSEEEFLNPDSPAESNKHWIPWLQNQLLIRGYHAHTPEMPKPYWPNYEAWSAEFERYDLSEDSLLIGHSCGGGFLLRYLSENPIRVAKLALVAPWLDPFKEKDPQFFDFQLDRELTDRAEVFLLESDNDADSIDESVRIIKEALPDVSSSLFSGYGHFCESDMNSTQFSELLKLL